jgi:TonB family protein
VKVLPIRPSALAGPLFIPLSFSIALHLAALAWLQPRSVWQPVFPQFDLSVRLAPRQDRQAAALVPPAPPPRPATQSRAARPGALPPPMDPALSAELAQQPLRMRIVANPADYGIAPPAAGLAYAWPGELIELPFPPEGILVRYPEEQLRKAEQGLVVVRAEFARSGLLESVEFICASPPYDAAVLEALRRTRFRAPLSQQGPVPAWTVLEVAFLATQQDGTQADPRGSERVLAELQKSCPRPGG